MAGVTETITIRIREDGSREVVRRIGDIGDAAEGAEQGIGILQKALLGLGAVMSFQKFAEFTGVWTDLNARIGRFNREAGQTEAVMARLQSIAQRTYAPLESISEIYLENAFALGELGRNTQEQLDYTEALTNALVVSGAKGQRQETVIRAMSKAMLEGTLSGENWNTVLQQGGRVVEALTTKTGKSLRELDRMARDKKLSSGTVYEALVSQLETLREEADEMPATIGDAAIRLRNRFIEVIGTMDERMGISSGFVRFVDFLNEHLEEVIAVAAGVGAALLTAFAPAMVLNFIAQVRALWTILAAHPFIAIAAAVVGVATAIAMMRDEIKLGIDDTTTLGDLGRAMWEDISAGASDAWNAASGFFSDLWSTAKETFGGVADESETSIESQEALWLRVLRTVAFVFDGIGATVRAVMLAVGRTIGTIIGIAVSQFEDLGRAASAALRGEFDAAADAAASFANRAKGTLGEIGGIWGSTFEEEFSKQATGGLEAWLNDRIARAKEIGRERAGSGDVSLATGGGGKADPAVVDEGALKKAARELERLRGALRSLQDEVDPVGAATRRLADAQETLNRSVAAGLIPQKEATAIYEELAFQMRDALDPLGALNRELDRNTDMLALNAGQRRIEADLLQMTEGLRRQGVKLTEDETAALRAKLEVEQQLARIADSRDYLAANSRGAQREQASVDISAFTQLQEQMTEGDKFDFLNSLLGGSLDETQSGIDARLEQLSMYYEIVQEFRDANVENHRLAAEAMNAIDAERMDLQVQRTQEGLTAIMGLMSSHNKTAFKIGQAAAIANATITGIQTAMNAYESASKIPYVGWILGPLAAAGAAAATAAQISKIRSQQPPGYRTGGTYTVGGHGGVDSQHVSLRATPGEQISINTPGQARAMERIADQMERGESRGSNRPINMPIHVHQTGKPDNKTPAQNAREMRKAAARQLRVSGVTA